MLIGTIFTSRGRPVSCLLRTITGRVLIISPCMYSSGNLQ